MNKKPKLTQEQKFLMKLYSKKSLTDKTLKIYIQQIKSNKITMSNISYFEKRYFELFDRDKNQLQFDRDKDQLEFFTACEQEKDKLQQELNEII
jgi:hypothetical protein